MKNLPATPLLTAEAEHALGIKIQAARSGLLDLLLGSRIALDWIFTAGREHRVFDCKSLPKNDLARLATLRDEAGQLFDRLQEKPSDSLEARFSARRDALRKHLAARKLHCSQMTPLLEKLGRLRGHVRSLRQQAVTQPAAALEGLLALERQTWVRERDLEAFFDEATRLHAAFVERRNLLVESNLRLVHAAAQKRRHLGMPLEDLVQEGTLALVSICEFFDPTKARFSTFASVKLDSALLRSNDNLGYLIGRPVHISDRGRKVEAVRKKMDFGVSDEELAAKAGLSTEELAEWILLRLPVGSLDETDPEGLTLLDKITQIPSETVPDDLEEAA
jgi:RNA polymerase sigma factor (sigma-70 family)